jgi:hypothetical protein
VRIAQTVGIVVGEGGVASRNHDCRARKRGKAGGAQQPNNQTEDQARQRGPITLFYATPKGMYSIGERVGMKREGRKGDQLMVVLLPCR